MKTIQKELVDVVERCLPSLDTHDPEWDTPMEANARAALLRAKGPDPLLEALKELLNHHDREHSADPGGPNIDCCIGRGADQPHLSFSAEKARKAIERARREPEEPLASKQPVCNCGCYAEGYQDGLEAQRERVGR